MNNVSAHDNHNLKLLYDLAGSAPYNPPTYTCITEFTDSFPKKKVTEFVAPLPDTKPAYQPEAPYPRIYTKNYKKSVLTSVNGKPVQ